MAAHLSRRAPLLLAALSLVAASLPPTVVARPRPSALDPFLTADRPGLARTLQRIVDTARVEFGMPGVSVAVRFPDGTSWTGVSGMADVARGTLVTPETPFALASISKAFVSGVVMGLIEDGRLHLGDSVARLLPGVRLGKSAIDPRITVRELLDHTSGLRDYLSTSAIDKAVFAAPTERWTTARALSYVGRPLAAPGAAYYYSNTNYVLLGLIVEGVTGKTLVELLHERWIDPLGLATARFQGREAPSSTPAMAYRFASNVPTSPPIDITDGTDVRPFTAITTASGPAGSLMASAADTAHWLEALVTAEVLHPETVARMVADANRVTAVDRNAPYGLGLQVVSIDGHASLGHSGRLLGARAVARYFPEAGLTIVVLTNQSRTDPSVVLDRLLGVLLPWRAQHGLAAS